MSSTDFPVGSIVYFLHNKTERVLPAQVVEKIVRTSLGGSRATYIIAVQSRDSIKKIEVDPSSVSIFQHPQEMVSFMVSRATEAIGLLVSNAVAASEVFEGAHRVEAPNEEAGLELKQLPNDDLDPTISEDDVAGVEDYESWHVPAAERPITGSKKRNKNLQK